MENETKLEELQVFIGRDSKGISLNNFSLLHYFCVLLPLLGGTWFSVEVVSTALDHLKGDCWHYKIFLCILRYIDVPFRLLIYFQAKCKSSRGGYCEAVPSVTWPTPPASSNSSSVLSSPYPSTTAAWSLSRLQKFKPPQTSTTTVF